MALVPLTADLLEFRLAENPEIERGWLIPHLCDIIEYDPDGCFAWLEDNRPAGMVTTTPYGDIGWLGFLYVSKDLRQKGLGARLTQAGIDHLRARGCRTVVIEAVEKAVPLYRRLGFVEQFTTEFWWIRSPESLPSSSEKVNVSEVGHEQMDDIAAFDRRYFHSDREGVFRIIIRNPHIRAYEARINGGIVGYLFGGVTKKTVQFGPFVVDIDHNHSSEIASSLAAAAREGSGRILNIKCPEVDPRHADLLTQLGAERRHDHTVRMYAGKPYVAESAGVLSVGCLGKG
jgi:GNAT superfamily N-acetyltransferase